MEKAGIFPLNGEGWGIGQAQGGIVGFGMNYGYHRLSIPKTRSGGWPYRPRTWGLNINTWGKCLK
jgi:hypothetical protein